VDGSEFEEIRFERYGKRLLFGAKGYPRFNFSMLRVKTGVWVLEGVILGQAGYETG
jgi:hypothetical protein